MALTPGSRLGVYDITAPLGEGGMGQVWRATDTTLGRQVAIKILPDAFAVDPDRLARFEREAKTLASLNHPHIAQIYGFEVMGADVASGFSRTRALVMELVEGEDLSQRIARRPIPLDEALPIAKQIAEALEAAHEQGIIHRDLKPANIKVRSDGTVKVLDFGLAKATGPAEGDGFSRRQAEAEASALQTITTPAMTQAGMILGTAAYMSPEQARGKTVDKRADIWAFGVVLYEMLTGARAFPGENLTDTLAAVVRAEPDWSVIPKDVSPTLLAFLKRSLQKDPKQRVSDIRDMRLAMEGAFDSAAAQAPAASSPSGGRLPMGAVAVAALAIVALAVPAVRHLLETPPPAPPETRLEIGTPATTDAGSFALSPDGRQIVYQVYVAGGVRLWLRSLAQTTAMPLAGTDGARTPFWSPDSRSIGFFADGAIKRLDLGGASPRTLAPALSARGATWGADGSILFAATGVSPLMRMSPTGSEAAQVTTLGPSQRGHLHPSFLPDGRRFLFTILGVPAETGIYLGSLDGGVPVRLTLADSAGKYLPADAPGEGGWLLWVQAGALVAQRLDVEKGALVGEPVTVADKAASISAVPPGLVAYRGADGGRQLTWVDRTGAARGTIGDPDGSLSFPRVSPDGRRVAVSRSVQGNRDIWLLDGTRASRLTFDPGGAEVPLWSPDGTRIVFRSLRTGTMDLYQTLATGGGEERFVASDQTKAATSWSRDGRFVLYMSNDARSYSDLWVVPTTGDRTPSVVLKAPFREAYGAFSPDGRWVAYHSNESGRNEVYVRPFVAPGSTSAPAGGQWQVSAAGGVHPVWRHDGKELYYLSPTGAMMAVPMAVSGTAVVPGEPVLLFATRIYLGGLDEQGGRQYDVAPDGRFLINMVLEEATAPITLIQHWRPEGKP